MDIISKFTVGSDKGVDDLLAVERSAIREIYKEKVSEEEIRKYNENLDFNDRIHELNNLSNQLIITYKGEEPVAYSILKSGSAYPGFSENVRITKLKLVVSPKHYSPDVMHSLWTKTKSAVSFTDIVWINVMVDDLCLEFLTQLGFKAMENTTIDPFSFPSYLLKMELNKI